MKCFYYKWINKKTGKPALVNFGWAESFAAIKEKNETKVIACVEIDKDEFTKLRKQGY